VLSSSSACCSLCAALTTASDHIWLCPNNRLLADDPTFNSYTLDLNNFSLVLPPDLSQTDNMPLILVGANCTLRLRNAHVYNAGSLAACLELAPGARLHVEESDGVELKWWGPEHVGDPLAAMDRTVERLHGAFAVPSVAAARPKSSRFQVRGSHKPVRPRVGVVCKLSDRWIIGPGHGFGFGDVILGR
jgi:hypothetical protein